jgi:hypothetical protein
MGGDVANRAEGGDVLKRVVTLLDMGVGSILGRFRFQVCVGDVELSVC